MKTSRKTVGVYEAPPKAKWPRIVAVIFALLVGLVVALGFGSRWFGEAKAQMLLSEGAAWTHYYNATYSTSASAPLPPSSTFDS